MKKIIFLIVIVVGILGIFLYIGCLENIQLKIDKIEVYSDIFLNDIVNIKKGTILNNKKIETDKLGIHKITVTYKNKRNHIKKKIVEIEVVDTIKPTLLLYDTYTVTVGTTKKLEESIFVIDNYDRNVKREIIGNYDINVIGEYPLEYIVTDQSGNSTRKKFTLKVIEEKKYELTTTEFNDILMNYKVDKTSIGIDVSSWQKEIDFAKVKETGVEFVMIRVGTQKGFDGELLLDTYFKENIEKAKEVGLPVGIYFFSYALTKAEAIEQANWVIQQIKEYDIDLPVVFDWESWGYFHSLELNQYDINVIADTFLKEIEKNGYTPMLYGSKNYLENVWKKQNSPVWLAHYNETTNYQGDYKIWQFCDNGKIDGINGFVDIDILYK